MISNTMQTTDDPADDYHWCPTASVDQFHQVNEGTCNSLVEILLISDRKPTSIYVNIPLNADLISKIVCRLTQSIDSGV